MAWIANGVLSLSNGSDRVTGSGTTWISSGVQPGWILQVSGSFLEPAEIIGEAEIRLSRVYTGPDLVDASYAVIPNMSLAGDLVSQVRALIQQVQGHVNGALSGRFAGGVRAAPSISFLDDPDTGVYLRAPNELAVAAGGIDAAVFGGKTGFGTLNPRAKLQVQQDAEFSPENAMDRATIGVQGGNRNASGAFGGAIVLSKPGEDLAGAAIVAKQTSADSDTIGLSIFTHPTGDPSDPLQEVFQVSHLGNVGIGTSAPQRRVHAHRNTTAAEGLRVQNAEGYADFLANSGAGIISVGGGDGDFLFYQYGRQDVRGAADNNNHKLGVLEYNPNFTNGMLRLQSQRAASNEFRFVDCRTSGGADTKFSLRGDGNASADGSWNSGGADYAEFFEWVDGNPSNEDRCGLSVVLVGDKIRPAQDGETPIGVVSATPSQVGNTDGDRWKWKFLTDDLGRRLTAPVDMVSFQPDSTDATAEPVTYPVDAIPDGVTVPDSAIFYTEEQPVLNPDYDPDLVHVSREYRSEWATVGLLGQIHLRAGQPVAPGWVKMHDVSATTEMWLVK